MSRKKRFNKESMHSFLLLGNTDSNFHQITGLENLLLEGGFYPTSGTNDLAVLGRADFYKFFLEISKVPGLISSRTLIFTNNPLRRNLIPGTNFGFLLLDSLHGKNQSLTDSLAKIPEVYSIYQAKGIYNTIAFCSFNNKNNLRSKLRNLPDIRTATLNSTESPIDPIGVEQKPQEITTKHFLSRNKYEVDYHNHPEVNIDYARGCAEMAKKLVKIENSDSPITMIYAPLRGAKPMLDLMLEVYRRLKPDYDPFTPRIEFPVTSSFVFYADNHPYMTKHGKKPASGRTTNILELRRLLEKQPQSLSKILYVDEIVSGGMLQGHVKEMTDTFDKIEHNGLLLQGILSGDIDLNVFGLTHGYGSKFSKRKEAYLRGLEESGLIDFHSFPIRDLVTEDQKFLLGEHYLMNHYGPNVVPFITPEREYRSENQKFWQDAMNSLQL